MFLDLFKISFSNNSIFSNLSFMNNSISTDYDDSYIDCKKTIFQPNKFFFPKKPILENFSISFKTIIQSFYFFIIKITIMLTIIVCKTMVILT